MWAFGLKTIRDILIRQIIRKLAYQFSALAAVSLPSSRGLVQFLAIGNPAAVWLNILTSVRHSSQRLGRMNRG